MTPPQFYDTDYANIRARLYERFELLSGRTLEPAMPEALALSVCAYEIKRMAEQNQSAVSQQLLAFASAPMLDYLADLQGVERLATSAATVSVTFTLASGHGGFTLPAGTRVGPTNGQNVFITDADVIALPADTIITVTATAVTFGADSNGFTSGQLTRLIDRRPELVSVTNTTTSGGGADEETDDELRERVRLASSRLSVAGPVGAYKYHTLQASPSIIDVSVTTPSPGTVNVYPLVQGGVVTPTTVLEQVEAALDPETVVPLTDTVVVISPTRVEADVEIEFELYTDADSTAALAAARLRVVEYLYERETSLGLDLNLTQLIAMAIGDATEVSDVTIVLPVADVVLDETQFVKTISLTTTVTATTDG